MFWLVYRQGGTVSVVITDAPSLILARLEVDLNHEIDQYLTRGRELPDGFPVPPEAVGKMLTVEEAESLLDWMAKVTKGDIPPPVHREASLDEDED